MTRTWWAALKHGGLLIAPSRLAEYFPDDPAPLPLWIADRLRRDVLRGDPATLLETVFETVCGVDGSGEWLKGPAVPPDYARRALTGESIKPRRLWRGPHGALLPVFWDDSPRLGVGRGRRGVARVAEWLRRADAGVAVLTNGRQFRLIHAGLDYDAWAEWDTDLWFEEGAPGPQVAALRALLAPDALTPPAAGKPSPLVAAILATRKGQAELSAELGERVRRAVEVLIRAHTAALDPLDQGVKPRHTYLAAVRIVMRMVVALFAEARELLPRGNPVYEGSYGIQALREELGRVGHGSGRERLRHRHGAWPRVLALFRLIHDGSGHEGLPLTRYDGALFALGAREGADPVARALAVFEDPAHGPSDAVVHEMLELLTRSRVKVRQGRSATWVEAPVDFGDLSSEYIGILYEGLLDYELKRAAPDDPVVFLRLGDEPALPLSRLEALDQRALRGLLEKLKAKQKVIVADEEAVEDEQENDEEEPEDEREQAPLATALEQVEDSGEDDGARRARERALAWASRVAGNGATALVSDVVLPGQWYLVRFGGTRKGAGTFYTRPALAVPTAQRTLRPLAYVAPPDASGQPDESAPPERWTPRRPEEILALKVCDPACGSGSFLVAALRFLTDALAESLHHHGRIAAQGESTLVTLADGKPGGEVLAEDLLPCRPTDDDFEPRLRARLKRYVVEQCLYGVDLDPLAVELCRLALWVETMDRELPFTFLDHKIRCGNALVGCWFDRFLDYPALAWDREGGDKGHRHGVHFEESAWTLGLREFRNDQVKPALRELITGQVPLFVGVEGKTPEVIHDEAMAALAGMHALAPGDTDERARYFRERIAGNPVLARLKEAFDTWCALWFWPANRLDLAPLPRDFAAPSEQARAVVRELAAEYRFFHWELEFPDVFAREGSGFDAILGNPPWEIQKPNSKEYFSNLDPLYRTYGKQEALTRQHELFEASESDEREWLSYCAGYKALGNFLANAAEPFELSLGRGSKELHRLWRDRRGGRTGYADPLHPFRQQGSADINTYKLFLELSHTLLGLGAMFGLIVPSGLYTDKGTTELRQQLLFHSRWRWLFGFENRDGIFDIHRSFKFCAVIVEKSGETDAVQTAFMRRDVDDWAVAERIGRPISVERLRQYSGVMVSFPEIRRDGDKEFLDRVYARSVMFGPYLDRSFGRRVLSEIHKTNDSSLFLKRGDVDRLKASAPHPDFRDPRTRASLFERDLHPIVEGKCVEMYDNGWAEPSIIMTREAIESWYVGKGTRGNELQISSFNRPRIVFREIASPTNRRSMIATLLPPQSMTTYTLRAIDLPSFSHWWLVGVLNSLVFDLATRLRGNPHLSTCYDLLPIPELADTHKRAIESRVQALLGPCLGPSIVPIDAWAEHGSERTAIRAEIDALVASGLGLPPRLLEDILGLTDEEPIGFWRVDREVPPERRAPALAIKASEILEDEGVSNFSARFRTLVGPVESPSAALAWTPFGGWRRAWEEVLSTAPRFLAALGEAAGPYAVREGVVKKVAEEKPESYDAKSQNEPDFFE